MCEVATLKRCLKEELRSFWGEEPGWSRRTQETASAKGQGELVNSTCNTKSVHR